MNQVLNSARKNCLLLFILAVGLFLRTYKPLELFMYSHDQDLAGWIVKDILIDKHLRLIGQETTFQGVFIGPLFYYLQIPFYLVAKMNPTGPLFLSIILGMAGIFSYYWCFSKIFNKKVGLIASFIYSLSCYVVFVDREVVPTVLVMLWTVWYFYGLWQVLKGESRGYLLLAFLGGLIWNINLALVILVPLILLAQVFSGKRVNIKYLILSVIIFLITLSPFLVFESRYSYRQTRAIFSSLTTSKNYVPGTSHGLAKLDRVFQLVSKNTSSLYWGHNSPMSYSWTFYFLVAVFVFLILKKIVSFKLAIILSLWQIVYILFFTFNSLNLSEYYLNGMNLVWITIMSLFLSSLLQKTGWKKKLGYLFILLFVVFNLYDFFSKPVNKSGYLERKALVDFIEQDSKIHGFPCVSVSYITSPGNDLGYRYLFWLKGMHVNQPISGSPVYTIVFPHSRVDRIDKSLGALGLVLPDYERYNEKEVEISCSGANSNLTDPMFGFTN